jgi:hypothetical protein
LENLRCRDSDDGGRKCETARSTRSRSLGLPDLQAICARRGRRSASSGRQLFGRDLWAVRPEVRITQHCRHHYVGRRLSRESRANCPLQYGNPSQSAASQSAKSRVTCVTTRSVASRMVIRCPEGKYRISTQCNADDEPLHSTKDSNTVVYLHAECELFWKAEHAAPPSARRK